MLSILPTNAPDQRDDLTGKVDELHADGLERDRLKAAAESARNARERAHAALAAIISDPMAFATTPDAELSAAKRALVSAAQAEQEAAAALIGHEQVTGDLAARGRLLRIEQGLRSAEQYRADYRQKVARFVAVAVQLASIQREMLELRSAALLRFPETEVLPDHSAELEKGAGLRDISFPPGVFDPETSALGARSHLVDYVMVDIFREFPDLVPAELAEAVSKRAADSVRWYATAGGWDTHRHRRAV